MSKQQKQPPKPQVMTQITHPEQVIGGGGRGAPKVSEHHTQQVDYLMGRERQKDLLAIICALIQNPSVYPGYNSNNVVVKMAHNILIELESVKP